MDGHRVDWTEFAENSDKVRTTISVRNREGQWVPIAKVGTLDMYRPSQTDSPWYLSARVRFVQEEGYFDKYGYRDRPQVVAIDAAQISLTYARDGAQVFHGFALGEIRVSTGLDEDGQPLEASLRLGWGQSTPSLKHYVGCPLQIHVRLLDEEDTNGDS